MMKTISGITVAVLLFSCGNKSAISKKLSGSDSLVITFNVPDSDSVLNIVSTTEKNAILKLAGFMNGKKMEASSCGFDGNMFFFQKGEILQTVVFQYNVDSCRSFLFELPARLNHSGGDNKVVSTKMSNESTGFLKSLAEGRGWY